MREWFFDPARSTGQGRPANGLGTERNVVRPGLVFPSDKFEPVIDGTYIDSANPNTNYSTQAGLLVESNAFDDFGNLKRAIFFFPYAIPVINTKQLYFGCLTTYTYVYDATADRGTQDYGGNMQVRWITNLGGETLAGLTWNTYSNITSFVGSGADWSFLATARLGGNNRIDLTGTVNAFARHADTSTLRYVYGCVVECAPGNALFDAADTMSLALTLGRTSYDGSAIVRGFVWWDA